MSDQSFVQRAIDLTFQLGTGSFGESGFDTLKVKGLRVTCSILKAGGLSMGYAQVRAFGLTLDTMTKLSTLGMPVIWPRRNIVTIEAGYSGGQMNQIYQGFIKEGWIDFTAMPEVPFVIEAFVSWYDAAIPTASSSYKGIVDVVTVIKQIAAKFNPPLTVENYGVSGTFTNPYFSGSPLAQLHAAIEQANISSDIDNGTLAIWPKFGVRGTTVTEVSKETGLVAGPEWTSQGIRLKTLLNPAIRYGSKILVKSVFKPANQEWVVNRLTYALESQMPNGQWACEVEAMAPGLLQIK